MVEIRITLDEESLARADAVLAEVVARAGNVDGAVPRMRGDEPWARIGWYGTTAFPPERPGYFDRQRRGALLWRRQDDDDVGT
jgi:hypothetical protein